MKIRLVWYVVLCAVNILRMETAENTNSAVHHLLQPKVNRWELAKALSVPQKTIFTGGGLLAVLALGVRTGDGVITRGFNTATAINTGLVIFCIAGSGYAFKRMVYDELRLISDYKKDIDGLRSNLQKLKEFEIPELAQVNNNLIEKLQQQDQAVSAIQQLVEKVMKTDERIMKFQEDLIKELKEVQGHCAAYEAMKKEVQEQEHNEVFLPAPDIPSSSSNQAFSSIESTVVNQGTKKKHGALSNLKHQLFGISKK